MNVYDIFSTLSEFLEIFYTHSFSGSFKCKRTKYPRLLGLDPEILIMQKAADVCFQIFTFVKSCMGESSVARQMFYKTMNLFFL